MIALIQRVKWAKVEAEGQVMGKIAQGLLVLLGIEKGDDESKADKLLEKIIRYRVFADEQGKMNLDVEQTEGGLLVVSQFTLTADTQNGLRPSFSRGADPQEAKHLYDYFCTRSRKMIYTQTGKFGADMQVSLQNDGPVTFWLQV